MSEVSEASPALILLCDYRAPAWRVETVEMEVELGIDASEIFTRLQLRRDQAQSAPLRLDGENLQLLSLVLDGQQLPASAWRYDDRVLEVDGVDDDSVLEIRVRVRPAANTALEGLYLSGPRDTGFLLTQCEAEGFRHITCFRRPARRAVAVTRSRCARTASASRCCWPAATATARGELPDGRHWARFVDPHPKPSYLFALVAGRLEQIDATTSHADGRARERSSSGPKRTASRAAITRCNALERAMRWDERGLRPQLRPRRVPRRGHPRFQHGRDGEQGPQHLQREVPAGRPGLATDDEYRHVDRGGRRTSISTTGAATASPAATGSSCQPEGRPHGVPRAELLGRHELARR